MTGRAHLVMVLAVIAIAAFIVRLLRRQQLRSKYALLWLTIGLLLLPLAAFPGTLETVSDWLGVFYAPTTLMLAAIGFLFLVVVHFSWELSRLEMRTRALAEEIALLRAERDGTPGGSGP